MGGGPPKSPDNITALKTARHVSQTSFSMPLLFYHNIYIYIYIYILKKFIYKMFFFTL